MHVACFHPSKYLLLDSNHAVSSLPCVWLHSGAPCKGFFRASGRTKSFELGVLSGGGGQVAMDCAKEMGCEESIVRFVMPLGTTVNMNGTALYEATTVIFLAQV